MTLGDRIRARRQALHMTQEELARALGCESKAAVSSIERGKENPTVKRVERIAEALSINPARLCGWE